MRPMGPRFLKHSVNGKGNKSLGFIFLKLRAHPAEKSCLLYRTCKIFLNGRKSCFGRELLETDKDGFVYIWLDA